MDPFADDHIDPPSGDEDGLDQDPAAAFLAQQRSQLAGLEDDDFDKVTANNDGFGAFGDDGPDAEVRMMNNQQFADPDYNLNGSREEMNNFGGGHQSNGLSGHHYEVPKIRPQTPDKIRKWREDQAARLEQKDKDEEQKKEELRAQAKKEIQDWYKLEEDTVKKSKRSNRDAEKDFVQQRDSDKAGEEWERVSRLCDFNPKSAKGTKDVSRLRSIILQLKQDKVQTSQ